jgi:hypothetical protein
MMGGDWLFSLEALALVGKAMLGNEWNGTEFDALDWQQSPVEQHKRQLALQRRNVEARKYVHLPSSHASSDYLTPRTKAAFDERKEADLQSLSMSEQEMPLPVSVLQSKWEANEVALTRLTNAAKWLGDKCRNHSVKTASTPQVNFPLSEAQSLNWNCTNDVDYWVRDGSIDVHVVGYVKSHRHLAFVLRADLEREMKTLEHSESIVSDTDLSRLPPYLKFAVDIALAQNWLIDGRKDTSAVREAIVIEKWSDAFPDIDLSNATKEAIAKVLGIPDATAINRSVKAFAKADKK